MAVLDWPGRLAGECATNFCDVMKTLRPYAAPTRNPRLNELLGLMLLVGGCLLLLALMSYTTTDPSLNTVGGDTAGGRPHNWTGVVGAYVSDAMLQMIGVAAFFLPLLLGRLGVCWMLSRPVGSPTAKTIGLVMWLVFAPAWVGLLPGHLLWRGALPIEGVSGRLLGDAVVQYLNVPGALMVLSLMVLMSLYLATTFTFNTSREWVGARFGFLGRIGDRVAQWRHQRRLAKAGAETEIFGRKREEVEKAARREEQRAQGAAGDRSSTLLGGLFGWWGRKGRVEAAQPAAEGLMQEPVSEPASMWEAMPRTVVDAAPTTSLGTATEAAAPYAEALAKASMPRRALDDAENFSSFETEIVGAGAAEREFNFGIPGGAGAAAAAEDVGEERLKAAASARPIPARAAKAKEMPAYAPPSEPMAGAGAAGGQAISFGKRADSDLKSVAIVPKSVRGYKLPPSSLLYHSEEHAQVREDALRDEARVLVEKCAEFDVDGQVTQINPGPVVTTFEFKPDAGVKYSRVTGLADDLCLAMAAESILIERMAGKSTVGIQVPNAERETIWLRDVVECESFAQSKSRLAIALGKDINGRIVTADLASMPHVLIAGSTGSGKSVAINAMIMSVLFKSTPEQVRMILVDPKRVELGMYEGIPHLFTPIITEAKLAANALRNAVREMERRLKLLASHHVRNIDQYNKMVENATADMFEDPKDQEPLPYIMIIIDELADLMMLDRSNVEEAITRLAQMARAVGIHLVLATQRPSVDVITGLIKANVPTRMSFRLATKVDSRTIIDSNGAESLLGRGDMLYLPPGTSRVQRVHAPFVTEKEIQAVTEFWKAQGEAEYAEGFLEGPKDEAAEGANGEPSGDDNDALYDDAVRLVYEFGKASTSLLQRRLRIGYGRAAHLIDMMHRDGLVGPADGSKPREILKSANWISEVDGALR